MRILRVKREKSFVCSLMNDWVVLKYRKSEFQLEDLKDHIDANGFPIATKDFNPNEYGTPIANGEEIVFEIDDTVRSMFVVTDDGIMSNELQVDPQAEIMDVAILTKGGWNVPGYPYLQRKDRQDKKDQL